MVTAADYRNRYPAQMAPDSAPFLVSRSGSRRLFAMTRFRLQVFVLLGFCTVAYVVSYVVSWFFG